jgi:nucleoside-diphosphate-sugar epimerase
MCAFLDRRSIGGQNLRNRIAIVGGGGFVGRSLARHLAKRLDVRILDVKHPSENVDRFATYVPCDITKYEEVASGLEGIDLVIHTAIVQIPLINENKPLGYRVNVIGTQNVCEAVEKNSRIKGMILAGTWHTIGEKDLRGMIDEEFGFRPDKVEERARLYALSKMAQEAIVRYYDEMSVKIYGIIRMGTVLGRGMPAETAASIFIRRGLKGESLTPFRHSMYRPMLYVDIRDICRAYETCALGILNGKFGKSGECLFNAINVYYPRPITILDLAKITRKVIIKCTDGKVQPKVEILDKGIPPLFKENDKNRIKVSIKRAKSLLKFKKLKSPEESLRDIVKLDARIPLSARANCQGREK